MTFLPIVDRELRVAARKRRTYWSRVAAAGVAIGIAGCLFIIAELERSFFSKQLGPALFGIFKWLSFAYAAAAGVFLTSDCLSEEKRDGTLGLLFLTDLRGYDVVGGKLLATSLRAAYGLLAAFPVIGLSFLLGGVTGGEFWRLMLLLCNTLLFSLAAGVSVSAVSRDPQRAMNGTMAVLGVFLIALPGIDWWMADWTPAKFVPRLSLCSPTFAFLETGAMRLGNFWLCMTVVHGAAWALLVAASFCAPVSWQEKAVKDRRIAKPGAAPVTGRPAKRAEERRRLLDENPIRWLSVRDRWMGRLLRIVIATGVGLFLLVVISTGNLQGSSAAGAAIVWLLLLVFQVWVASQASRFLLESRRNGAIELLLVTPLRVEQIVSGHWWALRRMFLYPGLTLMVAQVALAAVQIAMMVETMSKSAAPGANISYDFLAYQIVNTVLRLINFVTGLFAVAWFAMWMGLTSKTTNIAVIKTLVFVQILPALALGFLQMIMMFTGFAMLGIGRSTTSAIPSWVLQLLPFAISGLLGIGLDLFFIRLARRKVLNGFRDFVTRSRDAPAVPPPLPPVIPTVATPVTAA